MTYNAIRAAKNFQGPPKERIWRLMEQVMDAGMAKYDLAIWHWAQSDTSAHKIFMRTLQKRFSFAAWMFEKVGFDRIQAEVRGRMMVVYMMGESTLLPLESDNPKELLELKYRILTDQ